MKSTIADFPDWFGPMLVKELRQGLKTRGFVISFVGLQLVLILVLIYHVLLYQQNPKGFDPSGLGVIFWMLIGGLLIVVTPMRAFNELASERKANTLELIFMSGLSAWRITFGKWISLLFQSILFVLAVLPYAILRYYFGAVDLTGDLTLMLLLMLSCTVLSAVALAISGLPLWSRILAGALAAFVLLPSASGIGSMFIYGRSMGGIFPSGFAFDDINWWLVGWDILLVSFIALQVGAAAVAPLAENHAGSQRFLALLLWAPLPLMRALAWSGDRMLPQLFLFSIVAGVVAWYHLSTRPAPLHSYSRPFAGWRTVFGLPFQPGWPSAVLFLLFEVFLVQLTIHQALTAMPDRSSVKAISAMAAAALLCSTFVWRAFRRRAPHPLVEQSLFLILCGVLVAMVLVYKSHGAAFENSIGMSIIPSMAFWLMLDGLYKSGREWNSAGLFALVSYAAVLLAMSRSYWKSYFRLCHEIAYPKPSAAPLLSEP